MTRYRTRDSAYSWLVCFSAGICQVVVYGTQYSYGVFFVAFLEEYGESPKRTAWTASILYCLSMGAAPLASFCHKKLSIRSLGLIGHVIIIVGYFSSAYVTTLDALFFTYSTLVGFGASFLFYTINVAMALYFKKYLPIASSLQYVGTSVGEMMMNPLTQWIITDLGLRKCFLIVAGLHVIPCLFALVYDPNVERETIQDQEQERPHSVLNNYKLLCKDRRVLIFVFGSGLAVIGAFIPRAFMVKHCVDELGMSRQLAANVFIYYAIAGVFGRLLSAALVHVLHMSQVNILKLASFYPLGVSTLLLPLIRSYPLLIVYMIVYGTARGVFHASFNIGLLNLCGSSLHPQALGIFSFAMAVGYTITPFCASFLAEEFGSYNAAFYFAGCCGTIGAASYHLIKTKKKEAHLKTNSQDEGIDETLCVVEKETVL